MEQNHSGNGYAHGKIILMGEHSVVYGKPAIAMPFPAVKMTVTITKNPEKTTIDCQFYNGLLDTMPELLESLKTTILLCQETLKKQDDPIHIKIESTIPAERGMGSSAAVAVATCRGIYDYYHATLSNTKLLEIVDIAETIAHGNPSGLDAIMTSSNAPGYYIKAKPVQEFPIKIKATLLVADTGITGKTKEAVASIKEKLTGARGASYQKLINQLGKLTQQSRHAMELGQADILGELMSDAHILLKELGVSSNELDKLVQTALTNDALGAKLTGGGRGGCMIVLCEQIQENKITQALKKAGAKKVWSYQLGVN